MLKKEPSQDEEENEDEGSTANAEEYDPMEAEDAEDDDDDDDGTLHSLDSWLRSRLKDSLQNGALIGLSVLCELP